MQEIFMQLSLKNRSDEREYSNIKYQSSNGARQRDSDDDNNYRYNKRI